MSTIQSGTEYLLNRFRKQITTEIVNCNKNYNNVIKFTDANLALIIIEVVELFSSKQVTMIDRDQLKELLGGCNEKLDKVITNSIIVPEGNCYSLNKSKYVLHNQKVIWIYREPQYKVYTVDGLHSYFQAATGGRYSYTMNIFDLYHSYNVKPDRYDYAMFCHTSPTYVNSIVNKVINSANVPRSIIENLMTTSDDDQVRLKAATYLDNLADFNPVAMQCLEDSVTDKRSNRRFRLSKKEKSTSSNTVKDNDSTIDNFINSFKTEV